MGWTTAPELLERLRDPLTKAPVRVASDAELEALRVAIAEGRAVRRGGGAPDGTLDGALVTEDGRRAYPVLSGLPHMLVDDALDLDAPLGGS